MRKVLILVITMALFVSCNKASKNSLKTGDWKGEMSLLEGKKLPFTFKVTKNDGGTLVMKVKNASEEVVFDDIEVSEDSLKIQMLAFDGYIKAKFTDSTMTGLFVEENLDRSVPFEAVFTNAPRFKVIAGPKANIAGVWQVEFNPGDSAKAYPAKGIFTQTGNQVTGTFRTETGDYRFLEGVVDGDELKLSTFDGTHAYLFTGKVSDSMFSGKFYLGTHDVRPFEAKRNEAFELPDANDLTYLKEEGEKFNFSFPDTMGKMVSLSDAQFNNKVVLVQIMGTWCPNCLDETRYYQEYLKKNPNKNVQFVALAFEYAKTEERAMNSINRFKKKLNIDYPVLLAQYNGPNKARASEKLPMLSQVKSYPTTIFIDKKGEVRKIHTGFNGPATGAPYEEFKKDFSKTMKELLSE